MSFSYVTGLIEDGSLLLCQRLLMLYDYGRMIRETHFHDVFMSEYLRIDRDHRVRRAELHQTARRHKQRVNLNQDRSQFS
jgi:hypothetical protein